MSANIYHRRRLADAPAARPDFCRQLCRDAEIVATARNRHSRHDFRRQRRILSPETRSATEFLWRRDRRAERANRAGNHGSVPIDNLSSFVSVASSGNLSQHASHVAKTTCPFCRQKDIGRQNAPGDRTLALRRRTKLPLLPHPQSPTIIVTAALRGLSAETDRTLSSASGFPSEPSLH